MVRPLLAGTGLVPASSSARSLPASGRSAASTASYASMESDLPFPRCCLPPGGHSYVLRDHRVELREFEP
jgi:hypothetical protein